MVRTFNTVRPPNELIEDLLKQINGLESFTSLESLTKLEENKDFIDNIAPKISNIRKYSEMVEDLNRYNTSSESTVYSLDVPKIQVYEDQKRINKYYKFIIRDFETTKNLTEELCVNSESKLYQIKKLILCKYDDKTLVDNERKTSYSKSSKTFFLINNSGSYTEINAKETIQKLVDRFEHNEDGLIRFYMKCSEQLDCFHNISLIEEFYKNGVLTQYKDFIIKTNNTDNYHLKCDYCKTVFTNYQQVNCKEGRDRIENICNSMFCKVMRK